MEQSQKWWACKSTTLPTNCLQTNCTGSAPLQYCYNCMGYCSNRYMPSISISRLSFSPFNYVIIKWTAPNGERREVAGAKEAGGAARSRASGAQPGEGVVRWEAAGGRKRAAWPGKDEGVGWCPSRLRSSGGAAWGRRVRRTLGRLLSSFRRRRRQVRPADGVLRRILGRPGTPPRRMEVQPPHRRPGR